MVRLVDSYELIPVEAIVYSRWKPFDSARNFPDLGPRFKVGEELAHLLLRKEMLKKILVSKAKKHNQAFTSGIDDNEHADEELNTIGRDKQDLDWSTVLKRAFEAYIRGERPNMYGEWIEW